MKRAVLFLSIGAIVAFILAIVFVVIGAAQVSCPTGATSTANCTVGSGAGIAGIGVIFWVLGGLLTFLSWLLGIIATARIGRWGWFVLVLLISPLGALIYGIAGPAERAAIQVA